MNNFTTDERIEQFSNLMNPYVSEEFKEWLIESGFFTAPASIHHHGAYSGALFDHSFAVTKALLSFTERLELKWQLERSPYIVGMFHDCIRWHMGAFDDKENWNSYGRAVTNFPNVLYTHTADMAAARILGV